MGKVKRQIFLKKASLSKMHHQKSRIAGSILQILWERKATSAQEGNALKATGIVRRIDELGRVVIPKEIRRTLRIREGDPLSTTLTVSEILLFSLNSVLTRSKQQII